MFYDFDYLGLLKKLVMRVRKVKYIDCRRQWLCYLCLYISNHVSDTLITERPRPKYVIDYSITFIPLWYYVQAKYIERQFVF